jgi:membrane dipeptidase
MIVVDAHADLAWNALNFGRDYALSAAETRARERATDVPKINGQTMLGWPDWLEGNVAVLFVTLFATPLRWKETDWPERCYSNPEEAHQLYRANLDYYLRLVEAHPDKFALIRNVVDLEAILDGWEQGGDARRVGMVLLMEGADAVREPEQLEAWFEDGVRIVGPAWAGTRYAGGTGDPGPLTPEGRALLEVMDDLGVILDLSHMTEEGVLEALERYEGRLIVSHSSPLARVPHREKPERHLTDRMMVGVAERQGVIGAVLACHFLKDGWTLEHGRQAVGLDDVAAAIDHICQLTGDSAHAALGSDFDGGFGLNKVPNGIDTVADLPKIGEALAARGYDEKDIRGILGENWLRVLRESLPEE